MGPRRGSSSTRFPILSYGGPKNIAAILKAVALVERAEVAFSRSPSISSKARALVSGSTHVAVLKWKPWNIFVDMKESNPNSKGWARPEREGRKSTTRLPVPAESKRRSETVLRTCFYPLEWTGGLIHSTNIWLRTSFIHRKNHGFLSNATLQRIFHCAFGRSGKEKKSFLIFFLSSSYQKQKKGLLLLVRTWLRSVFLASKCTICS